MEAPKANLSLETTPIYPAGKLNGQSSVFVCFPLECREFREIGRPSFEFLRTIEREPHFSRYNSVMSDQIHVTKDHDRNRLTVEREIAAGHVGSATIGGKTTQRRNCR